jgi:glucokinase
VILAGDTGGTKTVLALYAHDAAGLHPQREAVFPCADYPSLEAIVDAFLGGDHPAITAACFGVAGPVSADGRTAQITNLPWHISAAILSARIGGAPAALLNDLQATALGTLVLPDDRFAVLQAAAAPAPHATIAVIAPGTGLGEALLVSDGASYRALPSEGGHADFAPGTDEEIDLLRYLRERHGGHVSYERVLSGAGLGELYTFARGRSGVTEPAWLTAELGSGDRNAVVAHVGLAGTDPVCAHALALFAEILGAEAGNLALRGLAGGGVVIGGGIPPKLLPALQTGALIARFNAKGRFAPWTRTLGVRVALEPRAALYGAAHHAATRPAAKDQP